jgi:hypothetical protein
MPKLFKSIFGEKTKAAKQDASLSYEQLEGVPLDELLKLMNSRPPETMPFGSAQAILRRLHQIALFDNHVPEEQRSMARGLAEALAADLEKSLSDNPKGLAAFKTAISQTYELARSGGYGSLVWRLNEYPMSGAETIPYVMKLEHRHLVPDFLEIVGPERVSDMRYHMIRQLILQANYNSRNSVLILHGLAAKGDKAVAVIFTPNEHKALLDAPNDYPSARNVLVALRILPAISETAPFKPVTEIKAIIEADLYQPLRDMTERAETDGRLTGLSENRKRALLLTLAFLRVELATAQLCQIYGEETAYDVVTTFSDPNLIEQLGRFRNVVKIAKTMTSGTPIDFALLDTIMDGSGIAAKSEEEFNDGREFFDMAVEWLNRDRVEFLDFLLSKLRVISEKNESEEDCISSDG